MPKKTWQRNLPVVLAWVTVCGLGRSPSAICFPKGLTSIRFLFVLQKFAKTNGPQMVLLSYRCNLLYPQILKLGEEPLIIERRNFREAQRMASSAVDSAVGVTYKGSAGQKPVVNPIGSSSFFLSQSSLSFIHTKLQFSSILQSR